MYIQSILINKIRSINTLKWEVNHDRMAGWHVIIGDNGSGKSTFIRSVALALIGPNEARALRQDWNNWLTRESEYGDIALNVIRHSHLDKSLTLPKNIKASKIDAQIHFVNHSRSVHLILKDPKLEAKMSALFNKNKAEIVKTKSDPKQLLWEDNPGWFSVAYGPFRRFKGGDKDYENLFQSNPRLAAHLSAFGEDVALTECLRWLQDLQFKKLEMDPQGNLIDRVIAFVNQSDFLPHKTLIKSVSSKGVSFVDGNGFEIPVEELSDGYRSVLSMTFELIRQLARVYGHDKIFDPEDPSRIIVPGVVLIDEIDAHLHPTWQRRIGLWFRRHFPQLQFIVTTHSPLICQAADVGTVFRLPKPGSKEEARMITGQELDRLLYGNVLDAYGTGLFGDDTSRSLTAKDRLQRLAELNQKELNEFLTEDEKIEQEKLRGMMPTSAHMINQA